MGRIKDAYAVLRGVKSAVGARHVVSSQQSGRPQSGYRYSVDALVNTGMKAAESVYGCMHFLGKSVAEAPLVVMEDGEPNHDHELSRLFARPSDHFAQSMLWYLHVVRKKASDKGAFLFLPLDSRGMPAEVWSKSSDEVRIIASSTTFIERFEERVDGVWQPVPEDTMVLWDRYPDPTNIWGSLAPLTIAQRSVQSLRAMSTWIDTILSQMGVIPMLISAEGYIEDEAFNRIRRIIEEEWAGSAGYKFLDNGARPHKLGYDLGDINFGELEDRIETRICAAFGVDPTVARIYAGTQVAGGLGGDKFAQMKRQSYDDTVIPDWKAIADMVELHLGPLYGLAPNQKVGFDLTQVQALAEDRKEVFELARMATWLTDDEKRVLTGYGPLNIQESQELPSQRLRRLEAPKARKAAARDSVERAAESHEGAYMAAALSLFAAERARAAASLRRLEASQEALRKLERLALEAVSEDAWQEALRKLIALTYGAGAEAAGLGIYFDVTDPAAIEAAMRRATKVTGQITETTRASIRDVIAEGRQSGASMADIAQALLSETGPWGGKITEVRAMRIARTESIGAANEGAYLGAKGAEAVGLAVKKEWVSAGDDKVREGHDIDGETVGLDEAFSNGLMYPGDEAGAAEDVINCRCSVMYHTE